MRILLFAGVYLLFSGICKAAPPIEAFGELPAVRSMALSPDGGMAAYIYHNDKGEFLIVYRFGEGMIGAADTDKVKAHSVYFMDLRHVILTASKTVRSISFRGRWEKSAAFSYSLDTKKITLLPKKDKLLYPAQEGMGEIVGVYGDGEEVFIPAYTGHGDNPPYSLLRVKLDSGLGRIVETGKNKTLDWIVDRDGGIIAREDYDNVSDTFTILTKREGKWRTVKELNTPQIPFSLVGVTADRSALVIVDESEGDDYSAVRELSFDGKVSEPIFIRPDADVEDVILDSNRVVLGVRYSGFSPSYQFFDEALNVAVERAQAYFAPAAAWLVSWSDDFSQLLFKVEGSGAPSDYYVFDAKKLALELVAHARPTIAPEDVGEVLTIEYKARDGLTIPALLTLPVESEAKKSPLIVMPHGGPEAHDSVGFDWMAQFFASRGYMVFQPNFRGSDGFGGAFRDAGHGEWGGKMQDDITDGVKALITSGRADPGRICIIGGSYGGYAALAGGAFTPDLYQCVAAIAPVSDLPLMLSEERKEHGKDHWLFDYWKGLIGDPKAERDKLDAISPVNHAAAFKAPVLLIHGKDDLTVPIKQSERMEKALKEAGKSVEFVRLKGEDHYLSNSETRLETLKALDAFVARTIGPAASPPPAKAN